MRKTNVLAVIMCISALLLTGCWDKNEPERLVYAIGMGLDYNEGQYEIFIQLLNFSTLAKTEGGGSQNPDQVEAGHAKGKTIDEAIFNLYNSSDRLIFWGDLSYVVYTEKVLKKKGIQELTDFLNRYRETRYQMYYFATKDSVGDIMKATPMMNRSVAYSKLSDPRNSYKQNSFIRPISMRKVIIELDEPPHQTALPVVKSEDNRWNSTELGPRTSLTIDGVSVIDRSKSKGIIGGNDITGFRWMTDGMNRQSLPIYKDGKFVASMLIYDVKVKAEPVEIGEKLRFNIKIKMKSASELFTENVTVDFLKQEIQKEIKKQIKNTFHKSLELDADLYRLSASVYRGNKELWKKYSQNGRITLDEGSIQSITIENMVTDVGKQQMEPTLK